MITYNTKEETVLFHKHWIRVHLCIFNEAHMLLATDIQRSLKQTTSKVTCKPFSQLQYIEQVEIAV